MKRIAAILLLCCTLFPVWSAQAEHVSPHKAQERVTDATDVMKTIMDTPDKGIPRALLRRAAAIAVFPGVVKAGFVLGGKYGRGVILRHDKQTNKWSPPAFFSIGAGSFGWQFGAQSTDLVLVIVSEKGLRSLIKQEFTLGGDASVAAGPVGRKAEANVDAGFKSAIYSYSRSRGLFVGISLEGAKINSLVDYNRAYYGKALSASDILMTGKAMAPKSALTLMMNLRRYAE
ncbi:MAG TPA: lipid-binding SYLF domain-containing protein [Mariprofundaceae bacterium]|nr:lipid-binding SYLF domain-containing protein [Mariprofundaceae bacterium]